MVLKVSNCLAPFKRSFFRGRHIFSLCNPILTAPHIVVIHQIFKFIMTLYYYYSRRSDKLSLNETRTCIKVIMFPADLQKTAALSLPQAYVVLVKGIYI